MLSVADSMFIWDITLRDPQIMVFKIRELFVSVLCMFMNPNATDKVLLERKLYLKKYFVVGVLAHRSIILIFMY